MTPFGSRMPRVFAVMMIAVMLFISAVTVQATTRTDDGFAVTVSEQVHAPPVMAATVEQTVSLNSIESSELAALTPANFREASAKSGNLNEARAGPLIASADSNGDRSNRRPQPAVTLRT